MKTETPRTSALIADIVQNPGLEWTRSEVEQLGEHAMQLERELTELSDAAKDGFALAKEWSGIASELVEDTTELPTIVRQIRAREIQLCRWHAKQLRKALKKSNNC